MELIYTILIQVHIIKTHNFNLYENSHIIDVLKQILMDFLPQNYI